MNEVTQPGRGRGTVSALALVAALTAFLVLAPLASAASDPIASGTTTINLTNGFYKKLKKKKVKIQKTAPAKVSKKGRVITLPVSEGEVDPTTGAAGISQAGGFKFVRTIKQKTKKSKKARKKTKKAVVSELVLMSSNASLSAKVGGKKMKFAAIVGYTYSREGFEVKINATRLKLTKQAAKQLNKKLGFPVKTKTKKQGKKRKKIRPFFHANEVTSGASAVTSPKTVTIQSGAATLKTDEATVKKMVLPPPAGFLIEIEPASPAQLQPDEANPFTPNLLFPVVGGTIAPDANAGKVQTGGGVKLVQTVAPEKTTTMTLNAIWVDLDTKTATVEVNVQSTIDPQLNLGDLGRSSIATISLAGANIVSDPANHRISVTGASSALQAVTAETLNSIFGAPWDALEIPHPTFAEGDGLGTFSFTVETQ